ncbi:MAG TPA: SAM-dependent methyltransferase [Actinomycetes bacterium]|nr:SAM-dependent methyltransferase [Actinomycetes bacterium]
MPPDEVEWLSSPEGRRVLAGLPRYQPDQALAVSTALRTSGLTEGQTAAVLTQSRLRSRVAERWGSAVDDLLFTPEGAEQATRPEVAALRAARYAVLSEVTGSTVADLGCGIGIDALAFARAGLEVDAFERDPATALIAKANAAATGVGDHVRVTECDVTSKDPRDWSQYAAVFADPARRRGGRRLHQPEQWSPPLSWVLALLNQNVGVKVAPGLDADTLPVDVEFCVVSVNGDVVEGALYRGALKRAHISKSATLLPGGDTVTDLDLPGDPSPVRPVGRYVHEPDGAVIRAGLVAAVAAQHGAWFLDRHVAYLSTDSSIVSPFMRSFEVHDVLPFSVKRLRAYLRNKQVGQVVVKKRASAVDVDGLQRALKLDDSNPGRHTLLLTRIGSDPVVIVASPVSARSCD